MKIKYLAEVRDIDGRLLPRVVKPFLDLHDGILPSIFQYHRVLQK